MEQELLLGHLSFLWATVVHVHCDHLYHLVQVDLEVWVVLNNIHPVYPFDLNDVLAVHDQKVVVNHLHHHLHHHHHFFLGRWSITSSTTITITITTTIAIRWWDSSSTCRLLWYSSIPFLE